jgi:fatty acid desaturase
MVKITQNSYNKQSLIYNGGAFCYALISYTLGLYGLFHMNLIINFAAILLLSHGMIIAAYLVHECAHNLVFKKMQHNTFFGKFLVWICGASYGTYEDIRYKHFRHHVDNDDVVWFDYEAFF